MGRKNRRSEREVPSWNRRRYRGWKEPGDPANLRDMTPCTECVEGICYVHDGGYRHGS